MQGLFGDFYGLSCQSTWRRTFTARFPVPRSETGVGPATKHNVLGKKPGENEFLSKHYWDLSKGVFFVLFLGFFASVSPKNWKFWLKHPSNIRSNPSTTPPEKGQAQQQHQSGRTSHVPRRIGTNPIWGSHPPNATFPPGNSRPYILTTVIPKKQSPIKPLFPGFGGVPLNSPWQRASWIQQLTPSYNLLTSPKKPRYCLGNHWKRRGEQGFVLRGGSRWTKKKNI